MPFIKNFQLHEESAMPIRTALGRKFSCKCCLKAWDFHLSETLWEDTKVEAKKVRGFPCFYLLIIYRKWILL